VVDLHRFDALVTQALRKQADDDERVERLRQALQLWRGPPLADVRGAWADLVRVRWQRRHVEAAVACGTALLRQGHPETAVDLLAGVASAYPLAETVTAALMQALAGCGRRAEALSAYAALRARLSDELGTDPGPGVQEVHNALLRDPVQVERVITALPRAPSIFVGRRVELRALDNALTRLSAPVVALTGTAGVGKTVLALHWAHRVAERFPDGQLFVDLHGFDPSGQIKDSVEALRELLEALDVSPERMPTQPGALAALFRTVTAGRRMLVVLDNARDAEHVRPLLPGGAGCCVVVTSRTDLTPMVATAEAVAVVLDLFSPAEARELLLRRLGGERVEREPAAVDRLIAGCGRLPIALSIAAARIARTGTPLSAFAAALRNVRGRLDALDAGDDRTAVRSVLAWSYAALGASAAELLRRLSLHPGESIPLAAAASIAGWPEFDAAAQLEELTRARMLVEPAPGRFAFHDLVRAYAQEVTERVDDPAELHAARQRMLDHYLHTACTAATRLNPHRPAITRPPAAPGTLVTVLDDHDAALAWFAAEQRTLVALVGQSAATGFDGYTWRLAWTLVDVLDRRGHWHDQITVQRLAIQAAERQADAIAQAHAHRFLGRAYTRVSRFGDAEVHFRRSLQLYREQPDPAPQADVHRALAWLAEQRGEHDEALRSAQEALQLYRAAGDTAGVAKSLNNLAWLQTNTGDQVAAVAACREALALQQALGDRFGEADTWDTLGFARHRLGEYALAAECYREALAIFRAEGDRYNEAETLTHLGDVETAAGAPDAAQLAWQEALAILEELGHPDVGGLRQKMADAAAAARS
jgi:tetratricopeptide (TPR) repeat protein